jgi:hypothetical protein
MTASKQSQDGSDYAWKQSSKPARNLSVPNVWQRIPDDGQKGCLKHVEFYVEVICQSQHKLFNCYYRSSVLYNLFQPTWPYSGNTHYIQNTWEAIINTKNYKQEIRSHFYIK